MHAIMRHLEPPTLVLGRVLCNLVEMRAPRQVQNELGHVGRKGVVQMGERVRLHGAQIEDVVACV